MNQDNIVNFSSKKIFYKLCETVLRSDKYGTDIDLNLIKSGYIQPTKKCKEIILIVSAELKLFCNIKACTCLGYIPGTDETTTKFSIAAVNDDSSVILLEKMDDLNENSDLYNLLEYFENLDIAYFKNYDKY